MQYYLCENCGKLYYIEKKSEIKISRKKLSSEDWEKYKNRFCQNGCVIQKSQTGHGNKNYNKKTIALRNKKIKENVNK
jgi:hypothetical protein